ncbi:hypothetical protein DFH09DRAFT_925918, partial [Mycena vulgaris]
PCACDGITPALFRCLECFNAPLWCRACIVRQHLYSPFHRIEEWDGRMFCRASLGVAKGEDEPKLTLQTDLKHGGRPCVNAVPNKPMRTKFTIAEHNGFHTIDIHFCQCTRPDHERWQQLLAVRLFPASFKQPQTAFTFTVLKQFHIHSLTSKKSAYDYVKALCKLTDNAGPDSVRDRYREFLFAHRLWRFLALQRRTGQAHGFDKFVPHRRPGSLTLRCPACPEVGFNISAETMKAALETERHKFTLFVSLDGNFKLQRKNKRDDPNDFALNDGNSYFVDDEDYKVYLKVVKPGEDLGTCSHLRAARMQNISKFRNAVITGVVAVQCTRHGFYLPQGMVDLRKGEAFFNTDYAICFALAEAMTLRWIFATYDIWCQYYIHLLDRISEMFPSMADTIAKIRGAIPKMHILNHLERCQFEWNLNWLSYVAFTVGEMIETGWAEHNLTAGSTKEMNAGHRHDVVDDTSNHWNWDKMVGLAASVRLYRLAVSERRSRTTNFDAVNEKVRKEMPEALKKWETMDVTPRMEGGKFYSVFQASFKNGPPTHAAAYERLARREFFSEGPQASKDGDLGLIDEALLAERDWQRSHYIRRLKATSPNEDIMRAARKRLFGRITELRTRQIQRVPGFAERMEEVDPDMPEDARLFLPSQFGESERAALKLEALAQVEYTLREGHAYDALMELRTTIRTFNYNLQIKRTDIHGVGANTRAQNFLKTLSNDIQWAGDKYRRARSGLVALGLKPDDETLQPLDPKKLHGKGGQAQSTGQSRTTEPWFWSTIRPAGMSQADEAEWEMDRKAFAILGTDNG